MANFNRREFPRNNQWLPGGCWASACRRHVGRTGEFDGGRGRCMFCHEWRTVGREAGEPNAAKTDGTTFATWAVPRGSGELKTRENAGCYGARRKVLPREGFVFGSGGQRDRNSSL